MSGEKHDCSHGSCNETTELNECKFCHKYFCKQHIPPAEPYTPRPYGSRDTPEARIAALQAGRSHPCPPFVAFKETHDQEQTRKYLKYLDRVSGRATADEEDEYEEKTPTKNHEPVKIFSKLLDASKEVIEQSEIILGKNGKYIERRKPDKRGEAVFDNLNNDKYEVTHLLNDQYKTKSVNLSQATEARVVFEGPFAEAPEPVQVHDTQPSTPPIRKSSEECTHPHCRIRGAKECNYCHEKYCERHVKPHGPKGSPKKGHVCESLIEAREHKSQSEYVDVDDTQKKALDRFRENQRGKPEERYEAKEGVHAHPYRNNRTLLVIGVVALCILIIIGALFLVYKIKAPTATSIEENHTRVITTTTQQQMVPFNNELIVKQPEDYINKEVIVKGYLKHTIKGTANSGVHQQYIVDDSSNDLLLTNLNQEQKNLFEDKSTTKEAYTVTGTITRSLAVYSLQVSQIEKTEHEYRSVDVPTEATKTELNEVSNSLSFGEWLLTPLNCENGTQQGDCMQNSSYSCSFGKLSLDIDACGCPAGQRTVDERCIAIETCSDGTLAPDCSVKKPLQCVHGALVENASACGCPKDYRMKGNACEEILKCSDGTEYGECAPTKPNMCVRGSLVNRASECGCPRDTVPDGDECVSRFQTSPKEIELKYTLRGHKGTVPLEVYGGLDTYLAGLSRSYTCYSTCPTNEALEKQFLDETNSRIELDKLVSAIRKITSDENEQARIAISIVQNIDYDWKGLQNNDLNNRYPYEVLYSETGVCGEKTRLLAYLLRGLGYGVVLFNYDVESHQAIGIKCPEQYDYLDSGYCFVESTTPSIITDSYGDYVGAGQLTSTPDIYRMSDGKSFDAVEQEYTDALRLRALNAKGDRNGNVLSERDYEEWRSIVYRYGIDIG